MADIGLYEAMSTLRAVRRLRPDPIPDDVLERVLQAAAWAPSGGNQQPWRGRGRHRPRDQAGPGRPLRAGVGPLRGRLRGARRRPAARRAAALMRTLAAGNHLAAHMQDAPVILVFCFDVRRMAITDADLDRVSVIGGASIYPAVQNLMLACVAEGLGCTLTTLALLPRGAGQGAARGARAVGHGGAGADRLSARSGPRADHASRRRRARLPRPVRHRVV